MSVSVKWDRRNVHLNCADDQPQNSVVGTTNDQAHAAVRVPAEVPALSVAL